MNVFPFSSLHYATLKIVLSQGMGKNGTSVSTTSLGKMLHTSQQTASRIVIDLTENGFLIRNLNSKVQNLRLTQEAIDLLKQEYNELASLLEESSSVTIRGKVESGLGEGRYYVSRKSYIIQFQDKLGYIPFLGTLNLRVEPSESVYMDRLRRTPGINIEGFRTEDRTFGSAKAFRALANGIECAVLMPERTVHFDVIELISPKFLREALNVADGSPLSVEIQLK
ncbi:MAG: DUF120 domain-containing protein [Candidatus Thermoplasmatota archaeon]|nr:DUF120 domain-containing protein [Candidatus Thermoplasmatota archaeon]MCL5438241.1 DUF120 domain-containing protein [Candidatus Thermoplasmatota archaeon]